MRTTKVKTSVGAGPMWAAALAALLVIGNPVPAQLLKQTQPPAVDKQSSPKGSPEKPAAPATSTLEEMLGKALKDNPDIRVAEAKVREAEAELNRTRLQVTQKVIAYHHSVESQKALIQVAQSELGRVKQLFDKGAAAVETVAEAQRRLSQAKAKLAEIEAEMPYLLGKHLHVQSVAFSPDGRRLATSSEGRVRIWDAATGQEIRFLNEVQYPMESGGLRPNLDGPPQGSIAEKIRKALDKSVSIDEMERDLLDFLKELERTQGIPFVIQSKLANASVTLHFEQMPLGSVLQAIEDLVPGVNFIVRDYGVLVISPTHAPPPGAVRLQVFWKESKGKDAAFEFGNESVPSANKNPPENDVQGVVRAVDPKEGLVTISIGSDAGLKKGNTLEVYRLKPKPKYLGTILIIEIQANEAVGKPAKTIKDAIQAGDHIGSRILKH